MQFRYDFHFVLMDDNSYRFEPDKSKFGAIAAFGDDNTGKNLESLFEKIWAASNTQE